MRISVQISTHNRVKILMEVLKGLDNQTLEVDNYEVIVIDDGSTDGTPEMVEAFSSKVRYELKLLKQPKLSLSKARNYGILNTDAEIILFIDDDVLPDPRLLEEHLKTHQGRERAVVNGWVNHITELRVPERPRFKLMDFSTSFFWTSNVSVARHYIIQAGLFSEEFTEYGWEDLELGYRLRKLGLKRIFNPKAIGYHYKPGWRADSIESAIKLSQAKARMAHVYLSKYPNLHVKLSTGYHWGNKLWLSIADLFNLKEASEKILKSVSPDSSAILTGKPLKALKLLTRYAYYRELFNR